MSRFIMTSNIDIKKLKADNQEDALKEFEEKMCYERWPNSYCSKDWFLCEVVAVEGDWNEPKGFRILRKCSESAKDE